MLDVISILLALVIGFLLVQAFDPVRNMQPSWAATLFSASLGTGIGLGLTALLFLVLDVSGLASPAAIFGVDALLLALGGWQWWRAGAQKQAVSNPHEVTPGFRRTWLLGVAFAGILASSLVRLVQMTAALPHGDWDAWNVWNLRAKFLAGPAGAWRDGISPFFGNVHSDYPVLLCAVVARAWKAAGNMDPLVPILVSLLYFGALVALVVSLVALLRGTAAAFLAGLVLLSTTSLLNWVPAQYADLPLAFYFASAIALLFLSAASNGGWLPLLWAGLCASFAACTKNEGIVFLCLIAILFAAFTLWRRRSPADWTRAGWLGAGILPGVLFTAWFKFFLAPTADPLVKQGGSGLVHLGDVHRYALIAGGFFTNVAGLGSGLAHPLILLAVLAIFIRCSFENRYRLAFYIATATLIAAFAFDCAALLITPYDLSWQIQTSFDRLLLQLWPAVLLVFFVQLRRVMDPTPVLADAAAGATRKVPVRSSKAAAAAGKSRSGHAKSGKLS